MSRFWANRKAAVQAEAKADEQQVEADAQALREAELADRTDAEILAELELPDPDTLEEGDDFKVFLTEAVPARIRTRALRRLWRLNPVLANVDGLVDYGEDFNDASFFLENMQTAYQVGKGMTEHVLELARQAEAEAEGETTPEAPEMETPEQLAHREDDDVDEAPVFVSDTSAVQPPNVEPESELQAPNMHRMRFVFDAPANPGLPEMANE
ncbi:DUF3306 domain-containing protein [Phaeobacter gallaeciensis]|uniref:DUF3306 domain-containing protein n=2 Tax=Roseobacteraceae TaxID=2854170 RepID=A0A366WTJ1_9RHOB|nr:MULTISPECIES: DUF3306 domain-containing protein [Roseobacteraceae]MBT3143806.1 DUF3306 domain-containing protein [Falsiruegeria litorea]MBT8169529.1 DUF3306 domain-containing protein [Falsiruegeria litorea]RBW53558.1 DUF3306 domain-containing protein [Phaeobacter gallaeciensis]